MDDNQLAEGEQLPSFLDHLDELRSRLIFSFIALAVASLIAFFIGGWFFKFLKYPLEGLKEVRIITTAPLEAFMIRIKLSFYGGFILCFPILLYQAFAFIVPALKTVEKKFIYPMVALFFLLFLSGAAMGHLVFMPVVYKYLYDANLLGLGTAPYWTVEQVVHMSVYSLLAIGFSFEVPIVVLLLVKLKLMSIESLRKQRRIAYFTIFVLAELIIPDMITPFLLMVPLIILYEGSILLAKVF